MKELYTCIGNSIKVVKTVEINFDWLQETLLLPVHCTYSVLQYVFAIHVLYWGSTMELMYSK